ncbi:MAG TPA: exosortase H-associated membrane protein [Thermoanaerobaculia bacterium]
MPRIDWRLALKALAGFIAGLVAWVFLSPVYDGVISAGAAATMRAFENPDVTRLRVAEDNFVTVDRADFDPRSKRPAIPVRDLTFNFILMTALFAASKRTFSDRNIGGFIVATVILAITHVFGVIAEVMSIYVAKLGPWSLAHYSDFERQFWGVTNHFYRLVLMYAIAFSLWWIFRGKGDVAPVKKAESAKKKRR